MVRPTFLNRCKSKVTTGKKPATCTPNPETTQMQPPHMRISSTACFRWSTRSSLRLTKTYPVLEIRRSRACHSTNENVPLKAPCVGIFGALICFQQNRRSPSTSHSLDQQLRLNIDVLVEFGAVGLPGSCVILSRCVTPLHVLRALPALTMSIFPFEQTVLFAHRTNTKRSVRTCYNQSANPGFRRPSLKRVTQRYITRREKSS